MSSTSMPTKDFDWFEEVGQTVTHSLVTTFGLDFLLLEDKKGGDVDTIHNVRNEVWATESEEKKYKELEEYDSDKYHKDSRYKERGKVDSVKQKEGDLKDIYRGSNMGVGEKRQLDHIISSNEVHNDAGRVLAGLDGVELANDDSNFASTLAYINNRKSNKTTEKFIEELPSIIDNKKKSILKAEGQFKNMPTNTPEQKHKKQKVKDKIRKEKEHIKALESIDQKGMIKADNEARKEYDDAICVAYYSSSKFFKGGVKAATNVGIRMGARQAVGLIMAEIWFELKEALPSLYKKHTKSFEFNNFWADLKETIQSVLQRVKTRFNDVATAFKDNFIGGILSSISTTIINILFTSSKLVGKLIRESWSNLVQAMKLVFFNPNKLDFGDLMREVTRIIMASVSTIIGVALNQHLVTVMTIPFGTEIAAFISALFIGLLTVGTGYFLDYSPTMQKVWSFLNSFKDKYTATLEFMKEANAEIDKYVTQLAKIEFNLNTNDLAQLSNDLSFVSNEFERSIILRNEVKKRNIDLPYEIGDEESTKNWLKSKFK